MNGLYGRELGIHRGVVKIQSIEELDEALAHPNKRAVQTIKMVSCPDEKISKLISAFNHGNLSILELCSCNFHAFPPNICFLSSLTELSLCQNSIMFLHADLSHLCRLQLLNISQNRLLSLSPLLLTLHDLRALDVSHNQIQSIAYGLESLSHLKLFCCSSNRISIVQTLI
jgi:Leucine-rich repeat (LRR) protein